MFRRRKNDYPCDWGTDTPPQSDEEFARLLTRTMSAMERRTPWIAGPMADFGYAKLLGMPIEEGETPLASGPALYSFSDQETKGTVLVSDQRTLFVWLDRRTNQNFNSYRYHKDIRGYRPDDGWGVVLAYHGDTGNQAVRPLLDRRDGMANRYALEWSFTLAAQLNAEFARREASSG